MAGGYQCFHCGQYAVGWDNDFNLEDIGYEGDGVVHICHCNNCGAEIQYVVRDEAANALKPVEGGTDDE